MTEREKMLAGLPYDAWDFELKNCRMKAKSLCYKFNLFDPEKIEERMCILKELLNMKGKAHIEPNFYCDYGFNISIGESFYSNHNLVILDVCQVHIGNNVMFGPNIMLSAATHPIDPLERLKTEFGKPIFIGDNVWLGGNVSVMPGIQIDQSSVIGAGSVVTRDIPEKCVAVGNPCRVIKSI